MRANNFFMMFAGGMFMVTAGGLFAQESSARFFRILATNQITITNFTDGVMTWEGQSAGAAVTVEVSEDLTDPDGWRRYTEIPGDDLRGSLKVFDRNTPDGMVLIPAGSFSMGDSFIEGHIDEDPVHSVYVSAFYMSRTEV
ncbi:MAG: formylglycine-generating enzyme family protein, partial [Pontiellaceae bacterium]|nr:formylglycine-generating enzyme family protein [Pontiellaceae bacterium]